MKRLVYVWLVCAAAGFAILVVSVLVLSTAIDHGAASKPPAPLEMRPIPQSSATSAVHHPGHDRLIAG